MEFNRGPLPRGATDELIRLTGTGRVPVLAHPERYLDCTLDLVRAWRASGVVIQTDARSLLGQGMPSAMARDMLAHGMIDILASDNHGDGRRSLAIARDWLLEHGGAEHAHLLTQHNPGCLLREVPLEAVPPFRGSGGGLRRLWRRFWA